jgi:hypothetical protein
MLSRGLPSCAKKLDVPFVTCPLCPEMRGKLPRSAAELAPATWWHQAASPLRLEPRGQFAIDPQKSRSNSLIALGPISIGRRSCTNLMGVPVERVRLQHNDPVLQAGQAVLHVDESLLDLLHEGLQESTRPSIHRWLRGLCCLGGRPWPWLGGRPWRSLGGRRLRRRPRRPRVSPRRGPWVARGCCRRRRRRHCLGGRRWHTSLPGPGMGCRVLTDSTAHPDEVAWQSMPASWQNQYTFFWWFLPVKCSAVTRPLHRWQK